ncbi:MAG: phospho-sugar mutase [Bacteriovoracaceae bacterium]|nr:phospho-sugar mutase [Bacteriovoracaceae bacterium]
MDLLSISQKKAAFWLKQNSIGQSSKDEIAHLLDKAERGDSKDLLESFCKELTFGTAGLRGIVGIGPNKLNIFNARIAAQALASSLHEAKGKKSKLKVVLSFDSRLSSRDLLAACVEVLSANEIECFAFGEPTPTPLLSFAIREMQADAGIMITASHNPKDYNGLKVYWDDGAQVTDPYDDLMMRHYEKISENWNLIERLEGAKEIIINETLENHYFQKIEDECLQKILVKNHGSDLNFIYTPLHGTGARIFEPLMQRLGFKNYTIVKVQKNPDGNFPTAPKPNPEEPAALKMASDLMIEKKASFAIGNDPDADRMGIVVNDGGKAVFLSGNEINNLMLQYKLDQLSKLGSLPTCGIVLKSLVSSTMQDKICKHFGVQIFSTLTGFKWMAKKIKELEDKKEVFSFLFASEESFGSMSHKNVRDKDGLSSAALFAEMALWHQFHGRNVRAALDLLYETFGYFYDQVYSYTLPGIKGMELMQKLMEQSRDKSVLAKWFGDSKIEKIWDFAPGGTLGLPASDLIKLEFRGGVELYLRPSGTEPKIKFYLMLKDETNNELEIKKEKLAVVAKQYKSKIDEIMKGFQS